MMPTTAQFDDHRPESCIDKNSNNVNHWFYNNYSNSN